MRVSHLTLVLMLIACPAFAQESTDPPPSTQNSNAAAEESEPQVYTIIQGQVVDALGRGVDRGQIEIVKSGDPSLGGKVQSDTFGDFMLKLEGAHPGTFKIKIVKHGFVDHEMEIEIDQDDLEPFVDVMLQGTLTVAGEVVEFLEYQPIVGTTVRLQTMYRTATTETDEAGRFEFKNLIPGFAEITAEASGFGRSKIQAKIGETPELIRIVLKPERILRMTVVDDQENPVVGAAVEIAVESANDYRNDMTDEAGQTTFRQLPYDSDAISVRLTHKDYVATGKYDHRIVFPEQELETRATLRLTPAAIIKGRITEVGTGLSLNGARIDVGEAPD